MESHAAKLAIDTPAKYFWITGGLSSVLDNAPTYLTFLVTALSARGFDIENRADVATLLASNSHIVAAISMGAVFFGAATYIGNGPNFMVKAIATEQQVAAPGFFAFIIKYALPILLPVFVLISLLFFR
ncbi:MAG: sodium:proton antiporter [Verrucomicrobiota bacterium]|nr:sodium:proton antiporter [Verrucomicrobiota bacterium]